MDKILVVRDAGALGDIVLSLPSFAAVKERFPDKRIELAGDSSFLELADELVDTRVRLPEGWWSLYSGKADVPEKLRCWLADFASIIFFGKPGSTAASRIASINRNTTAVDPVPGTGFHAADWYLKESVCCGSNCAAWEGDIALSMSSQCDLLSGLQMDNCICYAPGSGSVSKNWPEENFNKLISELIDNTGCSAIKILGPAERGEGEPSVIIPADGIIEAVNLPVTELAALLAGCAVYAGNDSGISHLAAAAGAPVVVLFGTTDPRVWAPRGRQVTVVSASGRSVSDISVMQASRAVKQYLHI